MKTIKTSKSKTIKNQVNSFSYKTFPPLTEFRFQRSLK